MLHGFIRRFPRTALHLETPPRIHALRGRKRWLSFAREKTIFSGIQPTGTPHLGNFLGALKVWKKLQSESTTSDRLYYCIVDLHALTQQQDPERLRQWKKETLAVLLAIGLDPERCTIFYQSAVRLCFKTCFWATSDRRKGR